MIRKDFVKKIIAAVATDDGKTFIDRHFGDATFYDIYEISSTYSAHIKRIHNTAEEKNHEHAADLKAKGIAGLLRGDKVNVLVSKKFGANIEQMKKKFVCILMNDAFISESIRTIQQNYNDVIEEWEKGEARHFITWRKKVEKGKEERNRR